MKMLRCRHFARTSLLLVAMLGVIHQPMRAQTASPTDGELKTVAVVALAPYEKLLSDIGLLGNMMGRPEASQMVEGGFAFLTQGRGPQAIDKKQPWGLIVQTDGATFRPIGCLPLTNPDDVLALVTGYGVQVKDAEDGAKELVLPNQQSVFFKHEAGWGFVSLSADGLTRLPEKPQEIMAELVTEYDLAAHISMKDVPAMYRDFAVQAMQAGVQQNLERREGETDEQYKLRQDVMESQMEQTKRTLNETESLTIGWGVDGQQQRTYVDYKQTFLPESRMAMQIAAYGQPHTNFAGFYQPDAALTLSVATQADPEVIEQDIANFEATMQTMRAAVNNAIDQSDAKDPEAVKAAVGDWFDALEATIRAGQMDGGAALHVGSDSLTLIAGAVVKDTAKIESGLKKLEAAAKARSPEFQGVRWNAAQHAGVTFHVLTVPVPEEDEAPLQVLGREVDIAVGIGPERVYLAVGKDNLEAVKKAIDASAAEPNKAVPPFELSLSLAPIMELAAAQADEGDEREIVQRVAEMLRNDAQDRDHIRAVGQLIPNGLRYRFTAEEGVLRAIGAAATEAQRQALQAQQ